MDIQKIEFKNGGYVDCKSAFYSAMNTLGSNTYTFQKGINILKGEIDSRNWAASYYLSMFRCRPQDFILHMKPDIWVDGNSLNLDIFCRYSCYMDSKFYPDFSTDTPLNQLIEENLKNNPEKSAEDVKELFHLSDARFDRPIKIMGIERFLGMAAAGYSMGKQVFCFPWMSAKRFDGVSGYLSVCFDTLKKLGMIAIVPVGRQTLKERAVINARKFYSFLR